MSQTNTNTNNGQNRNKISRRGGQGRGVPNGSGRGDHRNGRGNNSIAKYSFEGKMKDSPISKLTITKTGHRPSQFKKICDILPVFCADKNYRGLNEVLRTGCDKVKDDFMPAYPNATQWSNTHHVEIQTVDPTANIDATTGLRPPITTVLQKTHVFDANLQKRLLLQYKRNSKIKYEEYAKFLADKKALITIIFG